MDLKVIGTPVGAIIRAGLNTAPFTGGIASLWSEWDSERRFKRIEETLHSVAQELASRSFDPLKISEAEMHLLEEGLSLASREHREEKRKQFASVLAWNWTHVEHPFTDRELFLRALDAFSEVHVGILRILHDRNHQGTGPCQATDLLTQVYPDNFNDDQIKFGRFLAAYNSVAADFGMIRRKASSVTNNGQLMLGINPDGLVFHTECFILPLGERFVESLRTTL